MTFGMVKQQQQHVEDATSRTGLKDDKDVVEVLENKVKQ